MALISIYKLPKHIKQNILSIPESGMGFHFAKVDDYIGFEDVKKIVISNGDLIMDFENFNNIPIIMDLEKYEIKDSENFKFSKFSVISNSRYLTFKDNSSNNKFPSYTYFTTGHEEFISLSAYKNDKRITSTGGVLSGTYATTTNDMNVTPSGLAAVGRFALPNRLPAINMFRISPPPKTPIYFGTVTPDYGMCGGGVEVFFPTKLPSGTAKWIGTIPIK